MRAQKHDPAKACEWCGEALIRKRFSTGRLEDRGQFLRRKFCDTECQRAAQVNPHTTNRQTMYSRSQKHLRPACERCPSTKGLHVHHKDEDITNNDPSNLETLCASCHNRHHHKRRRDRKLASPPSETRSSRRSPSGSAGASSSTKRPAMRPESRKTLSSTEEEQP